MPIFIILLIIVIIIVVPCIKIVPQSKVYVIERIGSYYTTWHNGLHFKIPFIDRIANVVLLKEMVRDFAPQPVITKDNVTMQIDTVVYFQITDAKLRSILDEATDPWGIKVNRVEVKNILPPKDIQDAMEKQMRAERERREKILQAEGEKKSSILIAEGEKESAILRAEADKEARIKRAEGEAEALLKIKTAEADGIKLLKEAKADAAVLQLKSYETLGRVADGQATKIILPAELSNIATFGTVLQESLQQEPKSVSTKIAKGRGE